MITMYVDSREPEEFKRVAMNQGFIQMALDNGDYQSDYVVFERKSLDSGDLVQSVYARYGQSSRLFEQLDEMFDFCDRTGKIPWLVITGNWEHVEAECAKRGQTLNRQAIIGAIASATVRYDVNILWSERPFGETLGIMRSIAEKVAEGKLNAPIRRQLKGISRSRSVASISNALQISPSLTERLINKFGPSLYKILVAIKEHPDQILVMDGIGRATYNKMKQLGGVPDE